MSKQGPARLPLAVVMISRNRAESLLKTLEKLTALPEQPPIIVVDNASSDGTVGRVRVRFPKVRVIALDQNLGAGGRTVGVREAQTPYVAFSDDDSWWAPGALARAVDVMDAHPRVGLLAAEVRVGPTEKRDPTCVEMAKSPLPRSADLPGPAVLGFIACGSVVRKSAYLEVGGFEGRFGVGGEETLLAVDLVDRGWRLVYSNEIVAHHHPSPVRDLTRRLQTDTRNALWFTWLRRPLGTALRTTLGVTREAFRQAFVRRALMEALRGFRWVLKCRRPVSRETEYELRLLGM